MKISGRIILQKPEPVPVDLTRKELAKWMFGYFRAIDDAAKLATEADALMAEMAECSQKVVEAVTLRALRGDNHVPSKRNQQDAISDLRKALRHYQEYVK